LNVYVASVINHQALPHRKTSKDKNTAIKTLNNEIVLSKLLTIVCDKNKATYVPRISANTNQNGVALLLVLGMITLASVIVLNLSYKTLLHQETSVLNERKVRAEYLLKSALNIGRVIISLPGSIDKPEQKPWRAFIQGQSIPADLLELPYPNVTISLEISPENRKLSIEQLRSSSAADYRDIFVRLFDNLGFSTDQDKWNDGKGSKKFFDSRAMVAALIDYVDADNNPYREGAFTGTEEFSSGKPFPNKLPNQLEELGNIPGFTQRRIRLLTPHISTMSGLTGVNPNYASAEVLTAIDPSLTTMQAQTLIDVARGPAGPLTSTTIRNFFPNYSDPKIGPRLIFSDTVLQIIAKVQIDGNSFFLKSMVASASTGSSSIPSLQEGIRIY
jgi:hypothetical protein